MALSTLRGKPRVPLTTSNVMIVVKKVEKWWGYMSLSYCLNIPESKQEEIRARFQDEEDQKRETVSYWINTDPLASWRRLITALDRMKETELADSIRSNAEPLTDDTISLRSLTTALSSVMRFWKLLACLGMPDEVNFRIRGSGSSYSSEEEKREADLQYYLQTLPDVSWEMIAGVLWLMEEHTALETVKQYLPNKQQNLSLNNSNLILALEKFPAHEWHEFGTMMDVPNNTIAKIHSQFSSVEERKTEVLRVIASEHPYPTWKLVSDVLYRMGYHNVLERIQSLFPTGRRDSMKILEYEIKLGFNIRHLRKGVLAGIAGSGKTTSLQIVIGEEPPTEDERTSTPLLTRPVVTEAVFVENKVHWKRKTPEEKKKYIINRLREKLRKQHAQPSSNQDPASIPTSSSSTSEPSPVQSSSSSQQSYTATDSPTRDSTTSVPNQSSTAAGPARGTLEYLLQSSELDQEYIDLLNNPIDVSQAEVLHEVEEVYMVDSGGQPEFMEAMAVFLGGASVCVLVIDLSQSLDEHPLIGYWRRGKPLSKPYRCMRSNKQNLKRLIQTVNTFVSKTKDQPTKLLFLGTHRDKADQCLPETVADKNTQLKKLIPAKFEKQVIQFDKKKLIFEINALNPDDTDKKTAEKIRRYILKQCPAHEMKIPVRWDAFEDKLRSIAEGLGRQVMSRDECWQVAQTVGLEVDSFEEVLDFFHNWSLMFYFRDILPKAVFIDPQVLLDKVSELVVLMFE